VDLGLIYGVEIKGDRVKIKMTLTTRACPFAPAMRTDVQEKAGKVKGVKSVEVELVWDPPWTPERITSEARARLGV